MGRVASSTCTRCHKILPRTEMELVELHEQSGFSLGTSSNPRQQNSRRNSARVHFAKRKKWMCKNCSKKYLEEKRKQRSRGLILVGTILALLYFYYFYNR